MHPTTDVQQRNETTCNRATPIPCDGVKQVAFAS